MTETACKPSHPASTVLDLVVTILTLMLLAAAGGDVALARQAALETIRAYGAETNADLITVAKIVGFGLAALASISLGMTDDLPIATILRLHASANASDRSEHRNREVLKRSQSKRPTAPSEPHRESSTHPEPPIDEAALAAAAAEMKQRAAENLARANAPAAAATPAEAAADKERQYHATWAASAATIAAETAAALPTLPPDERRAAAIWIDVLNDCARDFIAGDIPPRLRPGDLAAMMPPAA